MDSTIADLSGQVAVDKTQSLLGVRSDVRSGALTGSWLALRTVRVALKITRLKRTHEIVALHDSPPYQEIACLSCLSHKYIVAFIGTCEPERLAHNIPRGAPVLIFCLYPAGDIPQYLKTVGSKATFMLRLVMVIQLVEAVEYMHGKNVIHGNIHGSKLARDDDGNVRLGGFGSARIDGHAKYGNGVLYHARSWMAKELIENDDAVVTKASDIWAVGMTALEIMTDLLPFYRHRNRPSVFIAISNGTLPLQPEYSEIPNDLWGIIQRCWAADPTARPSASSLLIALKALLPAA